MHRLLIAVGILLLLSPQACQSDDCLTDADCPEGRVCRVGLCALDPNALNDTSGDNVFADWDVNLDCRAALAGDLVLNEVLADPGGVDANEDGFYAFSDDEFVELVNVASEPVGLANVAIQVGSNTIAVAPVCLEANEAYVAWGLDSKLNLVNEGTTVSLLISGVADQQVGYGSASADDAPELKGNKGQSLTLAEQLNPESGWVLHKDAAGTSWSPGFCSHGQPFPDCSGSGTSGDSDATSGLDASGSCGVAPSAGQLIINEILAHPGPINDANGDGNINLGDEFVELVNISDQMLDISGVEVGEGSGKRFKFANGACLAPGQAAVMFGTIPPGMDGFSGALVDEGGSSSLNLNDGGDIVTVFSADGAVCEVDTDCAEGEVCAELVCKLLLASDSYGSEAGDEQSITREVDLDPSAEFVRHTTAPHSGGARMSPGTCQSGTPFPGCGGPVGSDALDGGASGPDSDQADVSDVGPQVVQCDGVPATSENLKIWEILSNPPKDADLNGDGVPAPDGPAASANNDDEFIEVVNISSGTVDLAGVTIWTEKGDNLDALTHTFADDGSACLPKYYGIVVFGGAGESGVTVSMEYAYFTTASAGSLGLGNTGDSVTLKGSGPDQPIIDTYKFSNSVYGVSIAREVSEAYEVLDSFVLHNSDEANGIGLPYSVGACVDGSMFISCLEDIIAE
jgi:hypothetical protein